MAGLAGLRPLAPRSLPPSPHTSMLCELGKQPMRPFLVHYARTLPTANLSLDVQVTHEDFNDAITEVQAKKKANLQYYA